MSRVAVVGVVALAVTGYALSVPSSAVTSAMSAGISTAPPPAVTSAGATRTYPWHTHILATTFWVGEVFDPNAEDGSQMLSTYDADWYANYGGCDGVRVGKQCRTQRRTAANGYFPTAMTPKQNPFYLDLPYDDLNDATGFRRRATVIPWAHDAAYVGHLKDSGASLMKNRWVRLRKGKRVCYGQIEDAGPGKYHDAAYVFGRKNVRPSNKRYNRAGLDVSPALNGCLGFAELNGDGDYLDWQFVEASRVPQGPWKRLVTTSAVNN